MATGGLKKPIPVAMLACAIGIMLWPQRLSERPLSISALNPPLAVSGQAPNLPLTTSIISNPITMMNIVKFIACH
jgi:hypothetical protein